MRIPADGSPFSPVRGSPNTLFQKCLHSVSDARGSRLVSVYNQESSQGIIRVQAPQFNKVSMAVQLTEELKAEDVLTRFVSQDR